MIKRFIQKTSICLFLLITALVYLPLYISPPSYALNTCTQEGISYETQGTIVPNTLPPDPARKTLTINFSISDPTLISNLKGKNASVEFGYNSPGTPTLGTYKSPYIKIPEDGKFTLTLIKDEGLGIHLNSPLFDSEGTYGGTLLIDTTGGGFNPYCSGISYKIGTGDIHTCIIYPSLQKNIPAGTEFSIPFTGIPNSDYKLKVGNNLDFLKLPFTNQTLDTKTRSDGYGVFDKVKLSGDQAEVKVIGIHRTGFTEEGNTCSVQIKIDSKAQPPSPIPTNPTVNPVLTDPNIQKCINVNDPTCTSSSAKRCDPQTGDLIDTGTGLITAIGCIPTRPGDFVNAFLRLAAAIGGGLAILLMFFGVFGMITSAGNPEAVKKGQDQITAAAVGLVFILLAVVLLQIIGVDILKIPGFK